MIWLPFLRRGVPADDTDAVGLGGSAGGTDSGRAIGAAGASVCCAASAVCGGVRTLSTSPERSVCEEAGTRPPTTQRELVLLSTARDDTRQSRDLSQGQKLARADPGWSELVTK